jgi:outer membrane protein assembly factor BamB
MREEKSSMKFFDLPGGPRHPNPMIFVKSLSRDRRGVPWMVEPSLFVSVALLLTLAGVAAPARADWPDFRGPWGDGHVSAPGNAKPIGFPLHWSETENVKWKTAIPFRGWSTPVVMDGQVWLTTATEDGHDFFALCVDAETGKILFNEKLFHCDTPEPLGNNVNSYATPSPVMEHGRVYVHFGSYGTACLDTATAHVVWQRDDLKCRHYRGPSSSPILFENLLILTFDGVNLEYTVALDKATGRTVWKTDRSVAWNDENDPGQMAKDGDRRKAHSTPLIVQTGGQFQMLSPGAKAAYSYDPRTGRELWRVHYTDWSAAPRPLFDHGLAYFITGLTKDELWAVKADGQGDVTDTQVLWKAKTHVGKYASPILVDGLIYTAAEESFVSCLEAATGNVVWTERIGGGYQASPIYADGRLYFFNQQGTTTVLKPGRACDVLATNTLASGFMASPAVAGKAFFLRTRDHLYRIESSASEGL